MPLPTVTIFGTINKIELKYSQSGMAICSFQIECSEKNSKYEWENLTLRGTAFEKQAEFINQWFQDGALCVATGKLITEMYEKDGKKNYTTKLKFPKIEFAPKSKNQSSEQSESKGANAPVYHERKEMPQIPDIDIDTDMIIPF